MNATHRCWLYPTDLAGQQAYNLFCRNALTVLHRWQLFCLLQPALKLLSDIEGFVELEGSPLRLKEQQTLFTKAMDLLDRGKRAEAAAIMRRVVESGSRDPKHLSFAGLLIATEEDDVKTGLEWCERALAAAFYDPQMYLNLARLHELTGWKSQAAKILRKGLGIDPANRLLLGEIQRISPRRPTAIPALARNNIVNRTIGRVRCELEKDKQRARVRSKISPSYS